MNKKPFHSKKFIALATGATLTTIFTLGALATIILVPIASSAVVNLMTVSLASINSVIGVYAIGQSAVDWKVYGKSETVQQNKMLDVDIKDERKTEVVYE